MFNPKYRKSMIADKQKLINEIVYNIVHAKITNRGLSPDILAGYDIPNK